MSRHTSARWLNPRNSNWVLVFVPVPATVRFSLSRLPARHIIASTGRTQELLANLCPDSVYKPAMPRLQQISRADAEAPIVLSMYERLFGDRDPVAEPGTATG